MTSSNQTKWHSLGDFLKAKEEREKEAQQKTSEVESAPTSSVAPTAYAPPTTGTAPTPDAPPTRPVAPTNSVAPPKIQQPPLQSVAPPPHVAPTDDVAPEQFTRVVNGIFDRILPTLKPAEQLVLLRLYRLTRGFNSHTCRVTIGRLANTCNIGSTVARLATQSLEAKGYIRRIGTDVANTNQNDRGIDFEMLLPAAAPTRRGAATRPVAPPRDGAPPAGVANKEKNINENTQTQEPAAGVRVGSRFSIEECRRYAHHLQSTGQGINNPGGFATTIHRTGEADALIEAFLNPAPTPSPMETSLCPDCQGSGFYYPSGPTGGVVKCRHQGLSRQASGQASGQD
jgi:hypothetical protein